MEIKNLFIKGWTSDVEPSLQPPNTARDVLNMRLISNRNNTYALESLKGTIISFSLNPGYFPIGWTRFGDNVVILSTKDINGTDKNGEIGIAVINSDTYIGTYTPYYNHVDLNFNSAHQIESQSYRENSFIHRVYWVDNYNRYRAINLNDFRYSTYFVVGALVVGVSYMVLTDSVTNTTSTYGPNEASGTVFVADGTEVYNGSPLVIVYVDVSLLDAVPSRDQGDINFNRWLPNGNLLGGGWQYCYRLFTLDGAKTNFSYVSMAFHIGNTTIPAISTLSYQAYQGTGITDNSQKGQRIQIDNIDTNFDRIQVVAIQDISLIATNPPVIFFDGPITGSTMTFDHLGNENLGTLSAADIVEISLSIQRVRTLAILKKRMFIGGVEFSRFVPFDRTGVTATPFEYLMPSDTSGRPGDVPNASAAGLSGHGISLAAGVTPVTGAIYKNQWYRVGGTGSIALQPSGTIVAAGATFQGAGGDITFTINAGAPTVIAVIRIQRYTGTYRYIDILEDYLDTKAAAVATHLKSQWRGETGRWGFLVYDTFQNPQYVQWIGDYAVPEQYDAAGAWKLAEETDDYYGAGLHDLSLRNIGMNFSGLDFNLIAAALGVTLAELPNYIGGFSIVRAPLDRQILGQGILGPTVIDGNNTRPSSTLDITNDKYGAANGRRVQTYVFHCPEFEFQFDNLPTTLDGDILKITDYYDDAHQAIAGAGTLDTNGAHFYSKMYRSTGASVFGAKGALNDVVNTATLTIGVGQTGIVYDPVNNPSLLFYNESATSAAAPGVGGIERRCIGSKTYLISTSFNEPATYPNGYVADDETRALVNYIRPKGNLYGGQGESALAATQYMFAGHYQPFDANFLAYITGNGGIADDIEVFGGDAYVCIMDVGRMIQDFADAPNQSSYGTFFPVESRINISLRQGVHLARDRSYETVGNTNGLSFSSPQIVEEFVYNTGYSYQEAQFLYPAVPANFVPNNQFERRIYVSPVKIDGELIDNFRIFPVNDYLDLEGQNGALVNLISLNETLVYLQERAMGYTPVNERETIPSGLGVPLNIGVGGVLQRYDDNERFFGNQNQFGVVQTPDKIAWFDLKRKTMIVGSMQAGVLNLSTAKMLRSYFAGFSEEYLRFDNPIRNRGIAGMYNARFEEMLFAFRGSEIQNEDLLREPAGKTVAYDGIDQQYTGKFSFLPGIMLEHNNILLCAYTGASPTVQPSTAYAVGEKSNEGTVTYACKLAYTSAGTPVQPSADTTHWARVGDINEVHVADVGDICKFFGYVDDASLQYVAHGDEDDDLIFDNMSAHSDAVFFDMATYENSHQNVTETGISTDVDNYQYLNRTWFWSVPYAGDEDRFRDHYLTVTLNKDNRLGGNPTVSKNERLKIVSVSTEMRKDM